MDEWQALTFAPDYEAHPSGQVRRAVPGKGTYAGKVLRPVVSGGTSYISLRLGEGWKTMSLATVIALAFLPRRQGPEVLAHLDGDKTNAAASNLAWCLPHRGHTAAERMRAYRARRREAARIHYQRGKDHRRRKGDSSIHRGLTNSNAVGV